VNAVRWLKVPRLIPTFEHELHYLLHRCCKDNTGGAASMMSAIHYGGNYE